MKIFTKISIIKNILLVLIIFSIKLIANNLNINTTNNTTIKGANLRANNIANINVGNNLILQSQR
ncbi:hemagglutinin repeat-containing protein, partial [Campylobacter majalis]|uniref:hemagglutinin repeat-containing protein n=1 Tax=Campylobacter majalis TaxID=2790656 RepID=UPI001E454DA2